MASGAATEEDLEEAAAQKTLVLKVSIHCEGCKRKVSKILSKIKGVESVDIDSKQNKVSFKSLVDAQTVIQQLKKHGKAAELLQEEVSPRVRALKPASATEKPPEPAKIGVESSSPSPSAEAGGSPEAETVMAVGDSVTETKEDQAEPAETPEKVKFKLKSSSEEDKSKQIKEDNTPNRVFPPQPAHVMSYDMAQPSMSQSHFVPPMATISSQGHIYDDQYQYFPRHYDGSVEAHPNATGYTHPSTIDPYNTMFSDENPDASCNLM